MMNYIYPTAQEVPVNNLNFTAKDTLNVMIELKNLILTMTAGMDLKPSCDLATTENIVLTGIQTIDGYSSANKRVLVKEQIDAKENGLYDAPNGTGAWTRTTDADEDYEITSGLFVFVENGVLNGQTGFYLTTADPITIGSSDLNFEVLIKLSNAFLSVGTTTNVGNAYTLNFSTINTIYDNMIVGVVFNAGNTEAVTFNFNGEGDLAVETNAGALTGYEIKANGKYLLQRKAGTPNKWILLNPSDLLTITQAIIPPMAGLTTGDEKYYIFIPETLDGKDIKTVVASVGKTKSSSGVVTVQLYHMRYTQDILTTAVTIDANEQTSKTAATPCVINTSYDDLQFGDLIRVDVDTAGTGTEGLYICLKAQ